MGRKNRMKSTFRNEVSPGSLWFCHKKTVTIKFPQTVEKGDILVVLNIVMIPWNTESLGVELYSQKSCRSVTVKLEDFYFNCHKL